MLTIYNQSDPFSYLIIILFTGAAVIVEPKTSPIKMNEQIIYGIVIALFIVVLTKLTMPNSIVIALLFGNIIFFFLKKNNNTN
jgi:Na+-translocating ferredoxin:NAD+ oxidoreductase RnfD subunit